MAVKIIKTPVSEEAITPPKPKHSSKSPHRRGSKAKGGKKQLDKITSLESSLEKFHSQTDEELLLAIQPTSKNADKPTHKLEDDQKEARYVLLHRLMIRKVPPAEICKQLGVSIAMYYKLRDSLKDKMRLDVNKVDVPYLIGDSLAFYDEVRAMALMMSSSASIKDPRVKVAAMTVALRAEDSKNEFLTKCGVYSAPVVEHIVRGMVSTGNYSIVDGTSERVSEANEINTALAQHLKSLVLSRLAGAVQTTANQDPVGG